MEQNLLNYIIQDNDNPNDKMTFQLKNRQKELNLLLTMNGFNEIGDLFDNTYLSINKTINVFHVILEERQKLMDSRAELLHKITKLENENYNISDKVDNNKEKMNELINKNNFFKNKITVNEKKYNEEIEKLKSEKDEANKIVNRLTFKDNQCKHEIKKLEKELEDQKNRLKKLMSENKNPSLSPTLKVSNTMNNNLFFTSSNTNNPIIDNFKNSANILHNINHMREFYNLIFQAFNEKIKSLLNENDELKQCYKIILNEMSQYVEYKKLILYKLSKDSLSDLKIPSELLNEKILDLDFNDCRELILTNFNDVINIFRFILMYDYVKIDPASEFDFDNITKVINNKKYSFQDIPFYNELKTTLDGYDGKSLNSLKNLVNVNSSNNRKKPIIKDDVFSENVNSYNSRYTITSLENVNKEFNEFMNEFENKFKKLENDMNKY